MGSNTQTHVWTHGTAIVYNPFIINEEDVEEHKEIVPFNIKDLNDLDNPSDDVNADLFKIAYTPDGCLLFPPTLRSIDKKCRLFLPLTTIAEISDFAFYFLGLRLAYDTLDTGLVISDLRLVFSDSREVPLNISIPNGGLSGNFLSGTTPGANYWDSIPPREIRKGSRNCGLTLEITFQLTRTVRPAKPILIAGAGYIYKHRGFDEN